jgi:hypothetical protein
MNSSASCVSALFLLAVANCAYTSDYVPPADGRARVIWNHDPVVMMPQADPACTNAVGRLTRPKDPKAFALRDDSEQVQVDMPVVIDVAPPPVLIIPGPGLGRPVEPVPGVGHAARPVGAPTGSGGFSLGSGNSSGSGADSLLVAGAVVAIATMPIVAIALALSRPENETRSAWAIDFVNGYNDLARWPGSACALPVQPQYQPPPPPVAPPPPGYPEPAPANKLEEP